MEFEIDESSSHMVFKRSDCFGLCCAPIPKPRLPVFLRRLTRRLRRHSATVVPIPSPADKSEKKGIISTPVIEISSDVEPTEQSGSTEQRASGGSNSTKLFARREQRNRHLDSDYVVLPRTELNNPHVVKTSQTAAETEDVQFDTCLPGQISDTHRMTSENVKHVTILDDEDDEDDDSLSSKSIKSDPIIEHQPSAEYLEQCAKENLQLARIARLVNTCPDSFVRRTLIQMNATGHRIYNDTLLALQHWSLVGQKLMKYSKSRSSSKTPEERCKFINARLKRLFLSFKSKLSSLEEAKQIIYNVIRAQYQFEQDQVIKRAKDGFEVWESTSIDFTTEEVEFSSDVELAVQSRQQQDQNYNVFQKEIRKCVISKVTTKFTEVVGAVQMFTNSTVPLVQRWAEVSCGYLPRHQEKSKSEALDRIAIESSRLDHLTKQLAHGLERDHATAVFVQDEIKNLERKLETSKKNKKKRHIKKLLPKKKCPSGKNRKLADFYMSARVPGGEDGLKFFKIPFRRLVQVMPIIQEHGE